MCVKNIRNVITKCALLKSCIFVVTTLWFSGSEILTCSVSTFITSGPHLTHIQPLPPHTIQTNTQTHADTQTQHNTKMAIVNIVNRNMSKSLKRYFISRIYLRFGKKATMLF